MKRFTNLYQLSKTLRFELVPDERSKHIIEQLGLIIQDEHRAESYKLMKIIIDRYHKAFIENVLSTAKLKYAKDGNKDSLEEFYELYVKTTKADADKKDFDTVQSQLRKQIVQFFSKDARFKRIDKKELIREDILKVILPEEKWLIEEFRDYTTYFTGFNENRKNLYSVEARSTAIAYRLIHENLPRFIDNIATFQKIFKSPVSDNLPFLYEKMQSYLNVNNIEEMFMLDYYNVVLTQTQIEVYNAIIGGKTLEDGTKIQGINEYVNLYNQKQDNRDNRLPKLKPLFKQLLSDREAISWLPEEFDNDQQLLDAIYEFYLTLKNDILPKLNEILLNLPLYDLNKIYIPNDLALTDISQSLYGKWGIIKDAITEDLRKSNPQKKNEKSEKYEERINKLLKTSDSFSIAYINSCLETQSRDLSSHFTSLGAIDTKEKQTINLFSQIENAYSEIESLMTNDYPKERNLSQDKENVGKLKVLLDSVKALQHFVRPLMGTGKEADKDDRFYGDLSVLWESLSGITPLYNKVR